MIYTDPYIAFNSETYLFKSFVDSSQKFYRAGLEKLDFIKASEDSRKYINNWVEEQTASE